MSTALSTKKVTTRTITVRVSRDAVLDFLRDYISFSADASISMETGYVWEEGRIIQVAEFTIVEE